jgi:hypothetical protein
MSRLSALHTAFDEMVKTDPEWIDIIADDRGEIDWTNLDNMEFNLGDEHYKFTEVPLFE